MVVRKLLESSIVGNFGLTLPTGSDRVALLKSIRYYLLII